MERKLLLAIQSLKTFPERHGKLQIERKARQNPYRFLPSEGCKIIYTVEEEPSAMGIIIELIHDSRAMQTVEEIVP